MDLIVLLTCWIWVPLIPLRIVLHARVPFWRRLKGYSLWLILGYCLVVDGILYTVSASFLHLRFTPLPALSLIGIVLILVALFFQFWTIQTLGLSTLFLGPEMLPERIKTSLVIVGPYSRVRHPFYLVDWLLLLGITLLTSSLAVLAIFISSLLTIPWVTFCEEKELVERFGETYRQYQQEVPRLIPKWR